ncbi:MAG: VOC family protein [Alphaproteobacteria bacterium]|nr:VOC family protein [Alphaproteobacteria bacterium]
MESRISLVTLGVRDLARARAFYEALGFKASSSSNPQITFFHCGAQALAIFPWDDLADDADTPPAGEGFRGVTLAHNVREKGYVDKVIAEAVAVGAREVKAAHDAHWGGRSGYFADPDGHLWEVAWNPFFPLAADGSMALPE